MPTFASSTNPEILRLDQLLGGIQKLNGRTAAIQRGLKAITKNPKTALRPAIEQLAEELICFLDETDGDPDLEDGNDAEPDEDGEPTLGSVACVNQERWAQGYSDAWYGGDEYESDRADDEPSLGARETPSGQSQEDWAAGGRDDREDDPAELGIADDGGMAEQWQRYHAAKERRAANASDVG